VVLPGHASLATGNRQGNQSASSDSQRPSLMGAGLTKVAMTISIVGLLVWILGRILPFK
jgi:hypothetical protein